MSRRNGGVATHADSDPAQARGLVSNQLQPRASTEYAIECPVDVATPNEKRAHFFPTLNFLALHMLLLAGWLVYLSVNDSLRKKIWRNNSAAFFGVVMLVVLYLVIPCLPTNFTTRAPSNYFLFLCALVSVGLVAQYAGCRTNVRLFGVAAGLAAVGVFGLSLMLCPTGGSRSPQAESPLKRFRTYVAATLLVCVATAGTSVILLKKELVDSFVGVAIGGAWAVIFTVAVGQSCVALSKHTKIGDRVYMALFALLDGVTIVGAFVRVCTSPGHAASRLPR